MIVLPEFFEDARSYLKNMVVVSGGFDPIHSGHLHYINCAAALSPYATLVAIVNGDGFLKRKKGMYALEQNERALIVDNLKAVDYTVIWDDGTQYVDGLLRKIRPMIFAKGGDRNSDQDMPTEELQACREVGCEIVYGIGGAEKLNSSRFIIDWIKNETTRTTSFIG